MLQALSLSDSRRAIHPKEPDCGAALCGRSADFSIANVKVVNPSISAWVKQRSELPGIGIYRSDVTAFEPVAQTATQSEILDHRLAPVLHRDHVIYLVFRQRAALNRPCNRSAASISGIARSGPESHLRCSLGHPDKVFEIFISVPILFIQRRHLTSAALLNHFRHAGG